MLGGQHLEPLAPTGEGPLSIFRGDFNSQAIRLWVMIVKLNCSIIYTMRFLTPLHRPSL